MIRVKFCVVNSLVGLGVRPSEKIEKPKICLPKYRKIRAILYNSKTADRIEAGLSLNKRANRAENTFD